MTVCMINSNQTKPSQFSLFLAPVNEGKACAERKASTAIMPKMLTIGISGAPFLRHRDGGVNVHLE